MSITFNGQTTELDFSPMTRAYMPEFMGLRLMDSDAYGQKVLYYGELEGGRDYDNEEFVISWPDGTQDVITYSRKLNRRKGDATQSWSLNGTKLEGRTHLHLPAQIAETHGIQKHTPMPAVKEYVSNFTDERPREKAR